MVELFKEFTFEAAHRVPNYSDIHGHSFQVEIFVLGEADAVYGWASSLTAVDPKVDEVQRALDHKFLNDIDGLAVPSLENIAQWIFNRLDNHVPGLDRVIVRRGSAGHGEGCVYRGRLAA